LQERNGNSKGKGSGGRGARAGDNAVMRKEQWAVGARSEQIALRRRLARGDELRGVRRWHATEPQPATCPGEAGGDEIGEGALAAHALAELCVVVLAAAHLPDQAHHARVACRVAER